MSLKVKEKDGRYYVEESGLDLNLILNSDDVDTTVLVVNAYNIISKRDVAEGDVRYIKLGDDLKEVDVLKVKKSIENLDVALGSLRGVFANLEESYIRDVAYKVAKEIKKAHHQERIKREELLEKERQEKVERDRKAAEERGHIYLEDFGPAGDYIYSASQSSFEGPKYADKWSDKEKEVCDWAFEKCKEDMTEEVFGVLSGKVEKSSVFGNPSPSEEKSVDEVKMIAQVKKVIEIISKLSEYLEL